jgi:hypothetical protein
MNWGCMEDSDCCNKEATCGTDRMCHLLCAAGKYSIADGNSAEASTSGATKKPLPTTVFYSTVAGAVVLFMLATAAALFVIRSYRTVKATFETDQKEIDVVISA